ncbi:MAG: Asp-tRNA(Asn)/Glu-tRNA(Gln) amidotransferase subunit GatB [Bacteroidota bacterium]
MAAHQGQTTKDPRPSFETVIGLEVHAQLRTASKAFSPDAAAFGAPPNTHVDPVSLGHPGTLPVFNAAVVRETLLLGLATESAIARRSVLARKHYFYPDLPKGYQISQYETPILSGGHVTIHDEDTGESRDVALTRIHLEEDAGKLVHDLDPTATLVDHNRCGVPLLEIVSEPDLRTPREAALYLQEVRRLVRWLGICDGNMEEGSLRCDANVSVRPVGSGTLGTKTEVKNLNSIRGVERAIAYEAARQVASLERGEAIVQETRLWDADRAETRSMRSKEEAMDYRYLPDPDLPPVVVTEAVLAEARAAMPELPAARRTRYVDALGLPAYDAAVLTEERPLADYFEATLTALSAAPSTDEAKAVSNVVMGDVLRTLNEAHSDAPKRDLATFPVEPKRLAALVRMRLDDQLSSSAATEVFDAMLTEAAAPEAIAEARDLLQVSDDDALVPVVEEILAANPRQVQDFRAGKQQVVGFFIGQVMRTFPGAPDPKRVRALLVERLSA